MRVSGADSRGHEVELVIPAIQPEKGLSRSELSRPLALRFYRWVDKHDA